MPTQTPDNEYDERHGLDLLDEVSDEVSDRGRRGPARWLFVVAALVVVILAIVGITTLTKGNDPHAAATSLAAEVRSASDVKTVTKALPEGKLHVSYSLSQNAFAVQFDKAPTAPAGSEYQLSVTTKTLGEKLETLDTLGAQPGDAWFGYRNLKSLLTLHAVIVSEGGEDIPGNDDLAEVDLTTIHS